MQLLDRLIDVGDQELGVGHRGAVGEQTEVDRAVVAENRNRQGVALGEEADRVDAGQLPTEHVEGHLGAGEVGEEKVEEPGGEVELCRGADQERRGEVAEPVVYGPQRLGAERLL